MKKSSLYLVTLCVASSLFSNEVSVYGAGDMNSQTPYGLTKNEQFLFEKTKELDSAKVELNILKQEVSSLKEQLEGARSVIEGANSRIGRSDSELQNFDGRITHTNQSLDELKKELQATNEQLQNSIKINEENNLKITTALQHLSTLIDSINNSYVSRKEIENLEFVTKDSKPKVEDLEALSGAELTKEAGELVAAKKLDDAKVRYQILLKKNYMPARNNFNLGEIAYTQQDWKNAIAYFKTSISLYDKADYIPKLLYHTAISFDKINEPQNANPFYQALRDNYPDSPEAKASPTRN